MASVTTPNVSTSATLEKINKTILQCSICFEQYEDPRALPCQHGFCRVCLEDWARKSSVKGKLACPTCRLEVTLPTEGVKGLPVHFLVSSLKDICGKENQTNICSNCNEPDKNAKFHCFDCKDDLCGDCHIHHNSLKLTKIHKVVTIEDLLSGKVSDEGRYCKVHNKVIVEFYCETEQTQICSHCISLNTCAQGHLRRSLQDAAKKQTSSVEEMIRDCEDTKSKHQIAVRKVEHVCKELRGSTAMAKITLVKVRAEYIQQLDEILKKTEDDIDKEETQRMKKLTLTKRGLEIKLADIEGACQHGSKVIQSGSEFQMTSSFASLSTALQRVNQSQPIPVDANLGYLRYVPTTNLAIPVLGHLSTDYKWRKTGQFSINPQLKIPQGIAINKIGDIAITGYGCNGGVKIFTRDGQFKCAFEGSPNYVYHIAVTPQNRYIIEDSYKGFLQYDSQGRFLQYDSQGKQLSKTPPYDMDGKLSNISGVAVDATGRIIAGLRRHTISIHQADGTFINKFATQSRPHNLAVTIQGDLVVTFIDKTVTLMDYSGGNVRVIQPPSDVTKWNPNYICCDNAYGEIYVGNNGDPKAVYGFTSEGEYLGLVTDDVDIPQGLAVTEDGQELFVVDYNTNEVKIFQRE